ncbi:MAG: hypothetical protein RH942_16255 [Kiloniellaceae bacterium]
MWFNDIDIQLRYPAVPPPTGGVAPGRHEAARRRAFERRKKWERDRRRHAPGASITKLSTWIEAPAARLARTFAAVKARCLAEVNS